jgi:hypothetical protein
MLRRIREQAVMWLIAFALVGLVWGLAQVVGKAGDAASTQYKKWAEPVHERAFRIAAGSGEARDASREAGAAAKGYLQAGDADKYREWKEKEEYWGGR